MLRFDANLRWLFTELPMIDRYEAAASAGFGGVEVAFPYEFPVRDIARLLDTNNLKLVQLLVPFDWDSGLRGIAALPERVSEYRNSLLRTLEYAAQVGEPFVNVLAGTVITGANREEYMETFLSNLAFSADEASKVGLNILIEPCSQARFPNFLFSTLDKGVEIIKKVGRSNIKLCFDTYHVALQEVGPLLPKLHSVLPWLGHIQIGNVPGRNEPGMGEIHFPFLFNEIEKLGWGGWIGCEYTPSADTMQTLSWGTPYGVGLKDF